MYSEPFIYMNRYVVTIYTYLKRKMTYSFTYAPSAAVSIIHSSRLDMFSHQANNK